MKPHFEKVTSGASAFRIFERADPTFSFAWHYHPEYELTLILDSRGQRLVGDGIEDYGPGDLVLIGPNLPHSWRSGPMQSTERKIHRAVVVQFRPDFLGDRFFELDGMESVGKLLRRADNGLAFDRDVAGDRVTNDVGQLPLLPADQRLVALLSILVKLAAIEDVRPVGPYRTEGLIHRTSDGTPVRSKSEVIVYDILASLGLSIRYEKQLISKSGNTKDFRLPDFTVHHQGRTWYWEHLGMLDKASYKVGWDRKQQWYRDNGYWDQVVTSEDHPGGLGGIVYADEIRAIARNCVFAQA